jgi:hypothetical protein
MVLSGIYIGCQPPVTDVLPDLYANDVALRLSIFSAIGAVCLSSRTSEMHLVGPPGPGEAWNRHPDPMSGRHA